MVYIVVTILLVLTGIVMKARSRFSRPATAEAPQERGGYRNDFESRRPRIPFPKLAASAIGNLCFLAAILFTVWSSVYQISAGYVGVKYRFGAITGQTTEGLQVIPPWESIRHASIQIQGQKFEKLDSFSNETQQVFVSATINTQVSPEKIQTLYREVGQTTSTSWSPLG